MIRKGSYNPETEAKKNYIAYQNAEMYAKSDIPLHPTGGMNCLTPKEIWADFDPYVDALDAVSDGEIRHTFTVKSYGEDALLAEIDVYQPDIPSKRAILIVQEYGKEAQREIITELTKDGYTVFVPDYCKIRPDSTTHFPTCVSYGEYGRDNGHLNKVLPTAKETCPYLYALILRRSVTFIEKEFGIKDTIVIGIRDGVEYAMQAAGIDSRIRGLGCVCAAGYKELLSYPVYSGQELKITHDDLAWITGVAGVSYLKNRDIPIFVAIGSNDTISDVDRTYFLSLLNGQEKFVSLKNKSYSENSAFYKLSVNDMHRYEIISIVFTCIVPAVIILFLNIYFFKKRKAFNK